MATNVTFSTLTSDIQNYLERGGSAIADPTVFTQIPRLINAAERKLMQLLKLQGEIEILVDAPNGLPTGNGVVTKPDRWRQTVSINYGTGTTLNSRTPLFPRSYEYCNTYWPDRTQTAPPEFYCDMDLSHWLVVPTPDQNYPLEVVCYMQPVLLDNNNQSNFFSTYTPNALLLGALMEGSMFLKDDERLPTWEKAYQLELQSLAGQDLQKILDRASERKNP